MTDQQTAEPPTDDALARAFIAIIQDWLTADELESVVARNGTNPAGDPCCATHDYCDPNQAMLDAHKKITGRELDDHDEATMRIVDRAWTMARVALFDTRNLRSRPADGVLHAIHQDQGEAETEARALAAFHGEPYTVWRRDDRFVAVPEHADPYPHIPGDGVARPTMTIDPRGVVFA